MLFVSISSVTHLIQCMWTCLQLMLLTIAACLTKIICDITMMFITVYNNLQSNVTMIICFIK